MSGVSASHMNVFGLHPVVMHGSDEQKRRWLPPIINGEVKACFGVTEANTGLNTLKLKTMPVRKGDRYVVLDRKPRETTPSLGLACFWRDEDFDEKLAVAIAIVGDSSKTTFFNLKFLPQQSEFSLS